MFLGLEIFRSFLFQLYRKDLPVDTSPEGGMFPAANSSGKNFPPAIVTKDPRAWKHLTKKY